MRKFWIIITLVAGLALSACGQQAPVEPTAVPSSLPTAPVQETTAPTLLQGAQTTPAAQETQISPIACKVIGSQIKPDPTMIAVYPLPTADDWSQGNSSAVMNIIVYSDFQCPYCAELDPILTQLVKENPNDVQVTFRHFPLPIHNKSRLSAQAAEAAGRQGKFFDMGAYLFAHQSEWAPMMPEDFDKYMNTTAKSIGLDEVKFAADYKSDAIVQKVADSEKDAEAKGINGTPYVLINSREYQGPRDLASFKQILNLFALEPRLFNECPPMTIDPAKKYTATLKTEKGDIVVQLFPDKAPLAVNSFIFLSGKGWYDNVPFHRVIEGFVAQTGDPSGTGGGQPGYFFGNETSDLKFDKPGVVAMANAGEPDTNGSQFFITLKEVPQIDGQYTIFGQVIGGMDIVQKLTPRDPGNEEKPARADLILSVSIKEE